MIYTVEYHDIHCYDVTIPQKHFAQSNYTAFYSCQHN